MLPVFSPAATTDRSEGMDYQIEQVASGLQIPWGLAFLSENQLLITERHGRLSLLDIEKSTISEISGLPLVYAVGQGGLLDVAVEPGYQPGDWIYFTYSLDVDGEGATTLARAKLNQNQLERWTDLLVTQSTTDTGFHYGSRIAFDDAGHVFFSIGDRGHRPNGQDLTTHAGSILRLNLDGSVPIDNPFINQKGALPEIWSYGHRNPQGLLFDKITQRLWSIEHGPRGGDEINLIERGKNYGWPIISYGKEYWGPVDVGEGTEKPGMEQPVKVYIPSIAPGSLMLYRGLAFPEWQGNLFSGALKLRHLNRVVLDNSGTALKEERLLKNLNERIRAVTQNNQGWIYLSTDSGKILRLRPAR